MKNKKIHFFNLCLWKAERKRKASGNITIGELDAAYNNNRCFEIEDGNFIVRRG